MTHKEKVVAAGYCRVSTAGQARDGLSLDDQEQRIREFAQSKGIELVEVYRDEGKSGRKHFTTSRPEFKRLLADALDGRFQCVIVYEIKRWSRNAQDYHNVKAAFGEADVLLWDVSDPGYDPANPSHDFLRSLRVLMGELQAEDSRRRSIEVRQGKIDGGAYNIGQRIPYGLRWVDKAGTALEHDPEAYAVWRFIMDLRGQGYGYGRIAAILNGEAPVDPALAKPYGVTLPVENRFGKRVWRDGAISSMFRDRSRYTGELEVHFKPVQGAIRVYTVKFPPLMTKAEYDKFAALSRHNLTYSPRNVGHGSVLSGLCRCGICGGRLCVTGNRQYKYYGCSGKLRKPAKGQKRCRLPLIQKHELEAEVLRRLAEFLGDDRRFDAALEAAHVTVGNRKAALAQVEHDEAKLAKDEAALTKREDRLADGVTDGLITKDAAQRKRQALDRDRVKVEARRDELASRRMVLERDAAQVERVEQARRRQRGLFSNYGRLLKLSDDKKRDLLRSLLPADGGAGITLDVAEANPADPEGGAEDWAIEIRGLLPVEDAKYKMAVLGGRLTQVNKGPLGVPFVLAGTAA